MRSVRGSSPKISSDTVTEPELLPSSDVTFNSMSRALRLLADGNRGRRLIVCKLELAGFRSAVRQLLLHRIAHRDPAAFDAGNGAFDHDQAARDVGLHHFEIERGHAADTEMARHLLVLECLARILPSAGRTDRAVRDRDAVGRPQAGKIPALHATGKALAGRSTGNIHELTDDEMIRRDLGADRNQPVVIDAELGELALGLDLGDGEMAAVGAVGALHLAQAGAELERDVAVLVLGAVTDNLAIAETQHRDRHVLAGLGEETRHSDLLRQHSGTHCLFPSRLYSLISTSTPAARSSFISASTVCGVGSTMSSTRLCVLISNCSRDFLSTCGERSTVNFSIRVGNGIGPRTRAPVRLAVLTISLVDWSSTRWSYALRRILMFWLSIGRFRFLARCCCYLKILATTPAPTVRPPSRIAKRKPSSIAMGTRSSTSIETLSPGITISVPSGNLTEPVTSVVRK